MRTFFLLVTLLGTVAAQSFGDDIDRVLGTYFGAEGQLEPDEMPISFADDTADVSGLTQQVQAQLQQLQGLSGRADAALEQLDGLRQKAQSTDQQLRLLDAEVTVRTQALKVLQQQYSVWQAELERATREVASLQSVTRTQERELALRYKDMFLDEQAFAGDGEWAMVQWLLGEGTAADIQERRRLSRYIIQQQGTALAAVQSVQLGRERDAQKAALYTQRLSNITQRIGKEKRELEQLANGKVAYVAQLQAEEQQLASQQNALAFQQEQAAEQLQVLQAEVVRAEQRNAQQDEITVEDQIEFSDFFTLPVAVDYTLSAGFDDAAYEAAYGMAHTGVDLSIPQGTDVLAPAAGVVVGAVDGGLGYSYVVVSHAYGFFTTYGHLSEVLVLEGQTVAAGELLGRSGGTPGTPGAGANSNGPHLHLELYWKDQYVDPTLFFPLY